MQRVREICGFLLFLFLPRWCFMSLMLFLKKKVVDIDGLGWVQVGGSLKDLDEIVRIYIDDEISNRTEEKTRKRTVFILGEGIF